MNNKLVIFIGCFIAGFMISFFWVNAQFANQTASSGAQGQVNREELPPGHPPVNAESAAAATASSSTGPLEAFGAPQKPEQVSEEIKGKDDKAQKSEKAEEAYKNIKVLKGLPADQVMVVMTSFTQSLGVSCTHCHTSMNPDEAHKDEKPAKEVARKMLTMTREINKGYPTGGTVTCFTCHRGSLKPVS